MSIEKNKSQTLHTPCSEKAFTLLLSKKYVKNFHLVDSPALSYSLATKSSEDMTFEKIKNYHQNFEPHFGTKKKDIERRFMGETRKFYHQLRGQVQSTIQGVYKTLQAKSIALSEVFEYNQLVLKGFLSAYLDKLSTQCSQESQFLRYIWNETMKLMDCIIKKQCSQLRAQDKSNNQQILNLHQQYQKTLQADQKKKDALIQQVKNLNQIVNYLVLKLRIKRKQVKKLYKQEGQLVNRVNTYKDQAIDSEIKCLEFRLQSENLKESEIDDLLKKKKELTIYRNKIYKVEQTKKLKENQIKNQINIEGSTNYNQFINGAQQIFSAQNNLTPAELEAQVDGIFDELEERFEERNFRMKKMEKNGLFARQPLSLKVNRGVMVEPEKVQASTIETQTTYTDKIKNDAISSIGVMVAPLTKKLKFESQEIQCNPHKLYNGSMNRVYQMSFQESQLELIVPQNEVSQLFKIKYIQSSVGKRGSRCEKLYSDKSIQCDRPNNQQNIQVYSRNSLTSLNSKGRISIKLRKNSTNHIIAKGSSMNRRAPIKSRFSNFENHSPKLKKAKKPVAVKRKQSLVQSSSNNQKKESMFANENHINIVRRKGTSGIMRQRKHSMESQVSMSSEKSERFTSLSRQIDLKTPHNISNILKMNEINQLQYQKTHYLSSKRAFDPQQLKEILHNFEELDDMSESDIQQLSKDSIDQKQTHTLIQNPQVTHSRRQVSQIESSQQAHRNFQSRLLQQQKTESKQTKISKQRKSGIIEKMITNSVKRKMIDAHLGSHKKWGHFTQLIKPIKVDVDNKIKQCTFKTKKTILPVKHKNLLSIISSVFSRSWNMFNSSQPLNNLLFPLYQTMKLVYGRLPDQQIYKKVINFIAQVTLQEEKICSIFVFFLGLNDNDQHITSFQVYLFLKSVIELSKTINPFKQLDTAYTTLTMIEQNLGSILQQQNLPDILYDRIFRVILCPLQETLQDRKDQIKFDLFMIARKIVGEVLIANENTKETFFVLIDFFEFVNSGKGVRFLDMKKLMEFHCKSKGEYSKWVKKLVYMKRQESQYFSYEDLVSMMLRFRVTSLEDFYVKVLTKFGIRSEATLKYLHNMKIQAEIWNPTLQQIAQYKTTKPACTQKQKEEISQIEDIFLLSQVERVTETILEKMFGKHLNQLYGISLIILK